MVGFGQSATLHSVSKGESLKDTTKIVSNYADILIIRHPMAGAVKAIALTTDCPVINAGDCGNIHPPRLYNQITDPPGEKEQMDGLTSGLCEICSTAEPAASLCKAL